MPEPTQPIPTTPGLSPADLVAQQQAQQAALQNQNVQNQQQLQRDADRAEKSIFRKIQDKTIRRGSLIVFQYNFFQHDPSPLCLVGKIWENNMVSGLNLHYLTFRYIKYLIEVFCGKNFHYGLIKGNRYIVNAYRSYKKEGRRQVKILDCEFLKKVLKVARSFKPSEIEAIRESIQKQLRDKLHPTADQVAKQYQESLWKQNHKDYNINKEQPDGRFNPTDVTPPGQV